MGSGELKAILTHFRHHGKNSSKTGLPKTGVPKGCLAIKVGIDEEKQQRFIIPVMYFNHPLFMQLLEEAENEYGFDQKGAITIPCHVDEFIYVQSLIDQEQQQALHHHHHQIHNHHHHHHQVVGCFRFEI